MIEKICEICKKQFKVYKYRLNTAFTCSDKCRQARHSVPMKKHYDKKGRNGWTGYNGYRYIFIDGKMVLEHRYVVENHFKIKLTGQQNVHHINHNRTDNRIENLEIMSASEHSRMHIFESRPWEHYALS